MFPVLCHVGETTKSFLSIEVTVCGNDRYRVQDVISGHFLIFHEMLTLGCTADQILFVSGSHKSLEDKEDIKIGRRVKEQMAEVRRLHS